jgi:hypothetical protein
MPVDYTLGERAAKQEPRQFHQTAALIPGSCANEFGPLLLYFLGAMGVGASPGSRLPKPPTPSRRRDKVFPKHSTPTGFMIATRW